MRVTIDTPADFIDRYQRIFFACHARHVSDPDSGHKVSAHQASILSHLDSVEPTGLGELATHMGVTPSTMSIAVDRLVRQGYVTRDRDPGDGRARQLRLTASGERLRDAQKVLEPELVTAMLDHLSPQDRQDALRGLELLASAANQQVLATKAERARGWKR